MRVGFGVDVHRFSDEGTVILCGVVVDDTRGIAATSDGDVALHAVIDALLGAAGVGDIGIHFLVPRQRSDVIDADPILEQEHHVFDRGVINHGLIPRSCCSPNWAQSSF